MGEKKRCAKMKWEAWLGRLVQCPYRAKYGDYCGVHSPEKKKERAAARGPTQWELDNAARKAEFERIKALESSHADLLGAVRRLLHWPSMHTTQSSDVQKAVIKLKKVIKNAEEKQ